mgnify:CR=1 FL=1
MLAGEEVRAAQMTWEGAVEAMIQAVAAAEAVPKQEVEEAED